jgi:hypothetical protein
MSKFIASQTMEDFMLSDAYVRVLAGPIGGGKSVCCAHELMRWACDQKPNAEGIRKTRMLIVRNTADQLRSTTKKTIDDWFPPGVYGEYKATEKTYYYRLRLGDGTVVQSEWMLIALDTPDDVRKALSLEATGIWGNEARELHPEVVDGLLMRVNRYPSMKDGGASRAGAIFDTNMPGEDSWWHKKMEEERPKNWSVHLQPSAVLPIEEWIEKYGEDPEEQTVARDVDGNAYAVDPEHDNYDNLAKDYYPNTLEGKTSDFIDVYLRCRYGRSLGGLPVYDKTFRHERHVAKKPLRPITSENYPLCIGLDFGRTPAAVIGQLTPSGGINILSEVIGENMGIQTFVKTLLKPHLFEKYPGASTYIAPDPAGWQKTQVGEVSPVDVLRTEGFKVVKPQTNKPTLRIEAVDNLLTQSADARPRVQIDPSCSTIIRGFQGGYRWKTNKEGDLVQDTEPVKNKYSHPHDALQYLALVIDGGALGTRQTKRREIKPAAYAWT